MSQHLCTTEHAQVTASILAMCQYVCEWADDATLFALVSVLAQHACRTAEMLAQQQYQEMHETMLGQPQAAMRTPVLRNDISPTGQPG